MDRTVIYHGGTLDGTRQTWGPDDPRPDAIGHGLDGHVSIYAFDQEDEDGAWHYAARVDRPGELTFDDPRSGDARERSEPPEARPPRWAIVEAVAELVEGGGDFENLEWPTIRVLAWELVRRKATP
jgi:hypothetical protein